MITEHSYGIIPARQNEKNWEILLVQHQAGHWSFPKGHAEIGETIKQTAERELNEETGLLVTQYLKEEPFVESYFFTFEKQKIHKHVDYFLALVEGDVQIQLDEIERSQWVRLSEAEHQVTFKEGKRICREVKELLT